MSCLLFAQVKADAGGSTLSSSLSTANTAWTTTEPSLTAQVGRRQVERSDEMTKRAGGMGVGYGWGAVCGVDFVGGGAGGGEGAALVRGLGGVEWVERVQRELRRRPQAPAPPLPGDGLPGGLRANVRLPAACSCYPHLCFEIVS